MPPVGLTLAGSDSGGGAGIQADIKSMEANGVYAASVITAVTAQNTTAVTDVHLIPVAMVKEQISAVCSDIAVDVAKTGMLSSAPIIEAVAWGVDEFDLAPLVVDPVMISKTGYRLLQEDAAETLIAKLLPRASVVTPNAHEAGALADMEVSTSDEARTAAEIIFEMGPEAVLVKGGHMVGDGQAVDVLYDGNDFIEFTAPFVDTPNTHGTGCTYASAIAAQLAHGYPLRDAIDRAKQYVTEAIRNGLSIGSGHGPTRHFYFLNDASVA